MSCHYGDKLGLVGLQSRFPVPRLLSMVVAMARRTEVQIILFVGTTSFKSL